MGLIEPRRLAYAMVPHLLIAFTASIVLGGCASADAHQAAQAQDGKASLRMVVNPAPGELYSLVLSGDGRTVAGTVLGPRGPQAFIWTDDRGRQAIPAPGGGIFVRVDGISHDGTGVAGYGEVAAEPQREKNAFLWKSGKGTIALGHLGEGDDIDQTEALAISGDGKVVAGVSRIQGARMRPVLWTEADGMRDLDVKLPDFSYPEALNGDGTVVAGRLTESGMHRAFRWSGGEGVQRLGEVGEIAGGGNVHSWPSAISRDGRVIAGAHATAGREGRGAQHAFRWTAEEGIVDLGVLPGGVDHSMAEAVNADGTVIVGSSGSSMEAFIWDAAHGMRSLKEVLEASGVDTKDWMLMRAVGVSDDGTRILGYGFAPRSGEDAEQVAFLATLTPEVFKKP